MSINFHPGQGAVIICDFSEGFVEPEMVKRRPAVVICPQMASRPGLCTVVALSTTPPNKPLAYHTEIELPFYLPPPFDAKKHWVKGDMVNTVGFHRLDLVRLGKDQFGKRRYLLTPVGGELLVQIQRCVLHGIGLSSLTKAL